MVTVEIRTLRAALLLGRALLVAALPATAVAMVVTYPRPPATDARPVPQAAAAANDEPNRELPWYAPLWQRDLKQPPIPPVVQQAEPPAPRPTGPTPVLIATFVEDGRQYAQLAGPGGTTHMLGVGEEIDGLRVSRIEPGRVQLQEGDRTVWIELPDAEPRP
jgi:hypothetical protein